MGFYLTSSSIYYEGDRIDPSDMDVLQRPSILHVYQSGAWVLGPTPVPQTVTMRQARLALYASGYLTQVNQTIAAMTGTDGDAARIDWEFAASVDRTNPLVMTLLPSLGLTNDQIDQLFISAAAID